MINHEKEIYLIFLLAVDRSWLSIRQASWTRFTIDHSKIQNECKFFIGDGIFSLLVRNPSAASAITMPANGESLLGRSSVIACLHFLFANGMLQGAMLHHPGDQVGHEGSVRR